MWRYLPPAVLMVCSALVLIAGATGDLQSWSQSIDGLPSWRTMVDLHSWPPVTTMWDSGMALLKRHASAPAEAAPSPPPSTPAPDATAGPGQLAATSTTKQAPDRQSAITQPAAAPANAASTLSAQGQAAVSPLQQRLMDARHALTAGHAGEARKMLETARAELAFRPTHEGGSVQIDMPATWVGRALLALKSGDSSGALHELDLAINST